MQINILRFEEIGSTNDEALRQARRGAEEGLCITAKTQTKGRGRHGRIWNSPPNSGIYFSIVLRPQIPSKDWAILTLMSAVAVFEAIRQNCGLLCDIKWANDIHSETGKKLGGILAETCETPNGNAVVVGIGINLKSDNFPPEIAGIATSVESETNSASDAENLLQHLTKALKKYYQILHESEGSAKIIKEWTNRSSYAFGKTVKVVLSEDEKIIGVTRGLQKDGALLVETPNGEIRTIHAGEVTSLRQVKR